MTLSQCQLIESLFSLEWKHLACKHFYTNYTHNLCSYRWYFTRIKLLLLQLQQWWFLLRICYFLPLRGSICIDILSSELSSQAKSYISAINCKKCDCILKIHITLKKSMPILGLKGIINKIQYNCACHKIEDSYYNLKSYNSVCHDCQA